METKHTSRGFALITFEDRNGEACSLQKSSIATEDAIWFGVDNANPQMFLPNGNPSWRPLPLPSLPEGYHFSFTTRMHLTQENVKELLPALTHFVETGELPTQPPDTPPDATEPALVPHADSDATDSD